MKKKNQHFVYERNRFNLILPKEQKINQANYSQAQHPRKKVVRPRPIMVNSVNRSSRKVLLNSKQALAVSKKQKHVLGAPK